MVKTIMENYYTSLISNLQEERIIELMQALGADRYIDKQNCIIFPTICHNLNIEEASMKLYYYKDNKFFDCYTEDGGMSIFSFLKKYYDARNYEYNWYEDILSVVEKCSIQKSLEGFNNMDFLKQDFNKYRYQVKNKELPIYSDKVLESFIKAYPAEWLQDGISEKTMDKFNILYSISQNKIIIPHYDIKGRLIGIRGRALDEWEVMNVGKYMPVKVENKWYTHKLSLNLYGLNHTIENIKKTGIVYLVESEKGVMQFDSFNQPNCCVGVCGNNFNKFQLDIILRECYPKEIVICFDKEEKKGEDKYFNKLYNIAKKYLKYCDFSFIYDRENLLKEKDSPTDKGEEVFMKLFKKRVKVK